MAILVTGGAGYIGSVTVEILRNAGADVVVIDNLVQGHRESLAENVPFYHGDVGGESLIRQIIKLHSIDSCIHFAAFADVAESIAEPEKYFENNTKVTERLVATLLSENVRQFVFSSTCAVYGDPLETPIRELHRLRPVNPYGESKLRSEQMLARLAADDDFGYVSLRYFNAAGATENCGEMHEPENHLIPNVLSAASGEKDFVPIFGDDYSTDDGTCVRDYVHVADLASAHISAIEYLNRKRPSIALNLGCESGYSVRQVIDVAQKVTGKTIHTKVESRREGDPAVLIADAQTANEALGFKTKYSDLENIIRTAWEWKLAHPNGYDPDKMAV